MKGVISVRHYLSLILLLGFAVGCANVQTGGVNVKQENTEAITDTLKININKFERTDTLPDEFLKVIKSGAIGIIFNDGSYASLEKLPRSGKASEGYDFLCVYLTIDGIIPFGEPLFSFEKKKVYLLDVKGYKYDLISFFYKPTHTSQQETAILVFKIAKTDPIPKKLVFRDHSLDLY